MKPTNLDCKNELQDQIHHASVAIHAELRKMEQAANICMPNTGNEISIKDYSVFVETITHRWHPMLIEVFAWFCASYPGQITMTSGFRKGAGIHGTDPMQAFDLRSSGFTNGRVVEERANQVWDYGKEPHQVCLFHRSGECLKCGKRFELDVEKGRTTKTICPACGADWQHIHDKGPHFHVQVRGETKRRLG